MSVSKPGNEPILNTNVHNAELMTNIHISVSNEYKAWMIDNNGTDLKRMLCPISIYIYVFCDNDLLKILKKVFNLLNIKMEFFTNTNIEKILKLKQSTPPERKTGLQDFM